MIKQIALTSLTLSAIGGSATGIYFLTRNNSIKEELVKNNKKLLSINAQQKLWEIKFHTYSNNRKKEHELNLNNFENLKNWCTNTLMKSFSKKDKDYESASILCTIPRNKENLLKEKKNIAVKEDWSGKSTTYQREGNGINAIPNLANNAATADQIQIWCNNALEDEYKENNGILWHLSDVLKKDNKYESNNN